MERVHYKEQHFSKLYLSQAEQLFLEINFKSCISQCLSNFLTICQGFYVIYLPYSLSVCWSADLSGSQSVALLDGLSVYLSVCLSDACLPIYWHLF